MIGIEPGRECEKGILSGLREEKWGKKKLL